LGIGAYETDREHARTKKRKKATETKKTTKKEKTLQKEKEKRSGFFGGEIRARRKRLDRRGKVPAGKKKGVGMTTSRRN